MYQLRTYTLSSEAALQAYASVHWARHIPSLAKFGIETHGIWRAADGALKLYALVSYAEGTDPSAADGAFMSSEDFRADMAGFTPGGIVGVDAILLSPTPTSPLR